MVFAKVKNSQLPSIKTESCTRTKENNIRLRRHFKFKVTTSHEISPYNSSLDRQVRLATGPCRLPTFENQYSQPTTRAGSCKIRNTSPTSIDANLRPRSSRLEIEFYQFTLNLIKTSQELKIHMLRY